MRATKLLVLAATVAFAACGRTEGVTTGPIAYCTAVAPIALSIAVRDSVTGRALADSASGTFRVDTVSGVLTRTDSLDLIGGRQIGTYSATITRPGYNTWTISGVAATKTTVCGGVATVTLTAKLQQIR